MTETLITETAIQKPSGEPPRYPRRAHFQRRIDKLMGEVCQWKTLAERQDALLERYRQQLRKIRGKTHE